MIEIRRYTAEMKSLWDAFVEGSKNGTFLFKRDYMDYHSDRFEDHSLICRDDKGLIIALLPANEKDGVLYSHQGLTYGGLIFDSRMVLARCIEAFEAIQKYLREAGFTKVVYKPVPNVYHQLPSDEDLFAIVNICGASLTRRMLSSVVDLKNRLPLRQNRRTALNKARQSGIVVKKSEDFATFWTILEENLSKTYGAKPVHNLVEIERLRKSSPDNIHLLAGELSGRMLGGIVLYETSTVTHTQYISATDEGKKLGVIDAIMEHVMSTSEKRYLDIGTSAGDNGELLNQSLLFQKEGFGGRGICYDTYEWEVK